MHQLGLIPSTTRIKKGYFHEGSAEGNLMRAEKEKRRNLFLRETNNHEKDAGRNMNDKTYSDELS
jgi:hypothetical protein